MVLWSSTRVTQGSGSQTINGTARWCARTQRCGRRRSLDALVRTFSHNIMQSRWCNIGHASKTQLKIKDRVNSFAHTYF